MRKIRIEKVTLNIGAGGPGEKLEKAKSLLEDLTGMQAKETESKSKSVFGVSKGREIGAKVTLRGEDAREFLERVLEARGNKISRNNFDSQGNLSIGIKEHIDLPETDYDPDIGIFGLDVTVTLERPGFHVKRRKVSKEVGKNHRISKEEAINFIKNEFDIEISRD